MTMAKYISGHSKVVKRTSPACPIIRSTKWAKRQMRGFGSMISFELGSEENAKKFLDRVVSAPSPSRSAAWRR